MMITRTIKKTISSLLLIFIIGTVLGQKISSNAPWFFIQITDPQFGMFENNEGFEKETFLYEKAVAGINNLKPDFVVITGDFVHNPNSFDQINEFKRITSKINPEIPVYYTPGNHDVGQIPDKKSLKNYRKNYGGDKFSFEHKGASFIGFNTSFIKAKLKKQEQKQYKWLTKKLKQSKVANLVILFCHYPFFNKTVDEPEAYSNIGPEYREKYLHLFEAHAVEAVFNGHHHNNGLASYDEVQLVTTSAIGKQLGDAPSGMRIVKIYSDKIEHEYFGLEELPESLKFD